MATYLAAAKDIDIPALVSRLLRQEAIRHEDFLERQAKKAKQAKKEAEEARIRAELREAAEARRIAEDEAKRRERQQKAEQERRAREEQRRKAEEEARQRDEEFRRRVDEAFRAAFRTPLSADLHLLCLSWPCTSADVRKAQRRAAKTLHPDKGGDTRRMVEINAAADRILRLV